MRGTHGKFVTKKVFLAAGSYKEQERQAKFAEAISTMVTNLQEQSKEVTRLVDAPNFSDEFFPAFASLKQQLTAIDAEMSLLQERQMRFKKWYDNGTVIDAEFREINQNNSAKWESVPEFELDNTPIIEPLTSSTALDVSRAANAQTKKKSLWSKMLS